MDLPPLHASPAALSAIANALNQHVPQTEQERAAFRQGQADAEALDIVCELSSNPSRETINWLVHRSARLMSEQCPVHCCTTCAEEGKDAAAEHLAARAA